MFGCFALFALLERPRFILVVFIAAVLSIACWWLCWQFAYLWNRRFSGAPLHHIVTVFAAILTFFIGIEFAALKYAAQVARASVVAWRAQILADKSWRDATFRAAYDAVKTLGIEDFSSRDGTRTFSTIIPTAHEESKRACAKIYAASAWQHFGRSRPLLSKLMGARSELPAQAIYQDMLAKQRISSTYDASDAVALVARVIQGDLEPQAPRAVTVCRMSLVLLFLLIQAIPLTIIASSAYRDLKVTT